MSISSYNRPSSIEEAYVTFSGNSDDSSYVAGGTDLLPLMRAGIADVRHLVDLRETGLPAAVRMDGNKLIIGSGITMSAAADHSAIKEQYPLIAQALLASASAQVRNAATIGGNLMQRTRCGYFRDPAFDCNKKTANAGCPAREGRNRRHAILGASEACVAVHASDLAVALAALDAQLVVRQGKSERLIALADFYLSPGETPWRETSLKAGEVIVEVRIPRGQSDTTSAYVKVRDRASFEFALVSAAVVLRSAEGRIVKAAVALGGVAPRPWRLAAAEVRLVGQPLTHDAVRKAVAAGFAEARPLRDNGFKVQLAQRAVERAVFSAAGVA